MHYFVICNVDTDQPVFPSLTLVTEICAVQSTMCLDEYKLVEFSVCLILAVPQITPLFPCQLFHNCIDNIGEFVK